MPHGFTDKEWAKCAAFDFTADCCLRNGFHYSATVPTRYAKYRRLITNGVASSPFRQATCPKGLLCEATQPTVSPQPAASNLSLSNSILMPQEALTSFFNAQIPMVELLQDRQPGLGVIRHRLARRPYQKPRPIRPFQSECRCGGHTRGWGGRGRFGRARPSQSYSKVYGNPFHSESFTAEVAKNVKMSQEATLDDEVLNIFGYATSNEPGPSSLTIVTLASIDPLVIEVSPGLIDGSSPNLEIDEFSNTDDITEQLASEIGDIDIDSMNTEEDIAPGKGKGG